MFSHVYVGTQDLARAFAFYQPVLAELGLVLRFHEAEQGWAGWQPAGGGRPLFIVGQPFDGQPHLPGNGQMVAFLADSRAQVQRVHAAALAAGGQCEGPPAPRPHYHPHYFGAYFRDRDGNKLAVACHTPEATGG
ncbi:VOC family protein [Aquincola tertiaricarbonis]|uniref:VOC family protein n=1 Tax=Aquincola tertiaricarbonis TaxID=391953 RepID=A0ABY4S9I2_AQUTE|nr:VOC family protein [Aquincola tertiaricarbonis]URI09129.1 VOC family protein [Aquincola tertiaricarbonis]